MCVTVAALLENSVKLTVYKNVPLSSAASAAVDSTNQEPLAVPQPLFIAVYNVSINLTYVSSFGC